MSLSVFLPVNLSVLVICLLLGLLAVLVKSTRKPTGFPPGPTWYPIVGAYFQVRKMARRAGGALEAYRELRRAYRSDVIGLKLGANAVVVISSYRLIRALLLDDKFTGRPPTFFLKLRSMGSIRGITSNEGETWAMERSFVVKHLRNVGFGRGPMERRIQDEVSEVIRIIDGDQRVKFDCLLSPSVLNVLWSLAAGMQIARDDSKINKLLDLLAKRTAAFDMSGSCLSSFPWLRYFAPVKTGYRLITDLNSQLKDVFMEAIEEHANNWTEGRNDDLIYAYISEIKRSNGEVFNYEELLIVCLDLFIAGSTTTSATLDFAFLVLLLRPDIQQKVQKTLDSAFESNQPIVYLDRHKVPYVEAFIMEVQRRYSVLPIIGPRRSFTDVDFNGYRLTKDMTIVINMDSIYNDPELFPDPTDFRPERFLDQNGELAPQPAHMPFGLGKRKCLGDALAKSFIFIFFAEIARRYSITTPPGELPPSDKPLPGITLSPPKYTALLVRRC